MAHIPQSQDDHQMTMEDSEHNFQNVAEDIPMVWLIQCFCVLIQFFFWKYAVSLKSSNSTMIWTIEDVIFQFIPKILKIGHNLSDINRSMSCWHVNLLCKRSSRTDNHRQSVLMNTLLHFWPEVPFFVFVFTLLFVCFLFFTHILLLLSLFLSFSLHTVACGRLIWAFLTSLQDVFREARSHDQAEAKNDMETHVRSRKLPLTRKIYAFYHAPIVKFWSNTVWRLQKRAQAHTHTYIHSYITIYYMVYQGRILGNRSYKDRMLLLRRNHPAVIQKCCWGYFLKGVSTTGSDPEDHTHFKGTLCSSCSTDPGTNRQ